METDECFFINIIKVTAGKIAHICSSFKTKLHLRHRSSCNKEGSQDHYFLHKKLILLDNSCILYAKATVGSPAVDSQTVRFTFYIRQKPELCRFFNPFPAVVKRM